MIDLLVAGGGPVGLATALHARRAGLAVTVIEPRASPIDKACGEGLMPGAVAHLSMLGVDPEGRAFHGIRYCDPRGSAEARFAHGSGRGVRRTTLVEAMGEAARAAGVQFRTGRVRDARAIPGGIEAAGIRARYLVGADGLHSSIRALIGAEGSCRREHRFGIRQHFTVEPWTDLVEVHWLRSVEVYVTPVADDTVGIAVLGPRPLSLARAIASVPAIAARLRDAAVASSERGAGPLRQPTTARGSGRVLLVGDAAGYLDALTGEGLRLGFAEAQAAVAAIASDDPVGYENDWQEITRSYRRLTSSLLWAAERPLLRRLIVPSARVVPPVFRRCVNTLAG